MGLRSTRHMTSVFLVRAGGVLLLFRRGSRVIADSWVGIGGHVEPHEHTDPTAAALRELHEEIGVTPDQLTNLSMRYVALRDTGTELRTTYYFTADLHPNAPIPAECAEGELRWFDLTLDPATLECRPAPATSYPTG
ncbi:NUDIX domain-containing protein [Kribbella solani]|uniref:8-oxo-dGTP diphosphatase n=1 Tax=Kribbella solani TaxID=236067 RepID=A0A841DN40_9ACTN|nr:NUDIX domain-containing protein [Kribbella solani]MBB5978186.1 8-oxo-dGTP diphosphatase [Kribbella solani]